MRNNVALQVELNGAGSCGQDDAEEDPDALSLLTIHKSQGTEFDIIYIFTVDDDAESRSFDFPWTQKRRLINVAASRAKEELHIITSTNLMSEGIQQRLVGYAINPGHQNSAKDYFVEKLIDYAYAYFKAFPNLQEDTFGFFRARTFSVFDKKTYQMRIDGVDLKSSIEDCMQEALNGSAVITSMKFKVGYEHPISQFIDDDPNAQRAYNSLMDPELKAFLRTDTHMDFPITTENGILLLDVEVDGEQHKEEVQAKRDRMKDSFLRDTLGIPVMRFLDLGNRYMDDNAVTGADIVSDDLSEIDHIERELIRRFQQIRTGDKYYLY